MGTGHEAVPEVDGYSNLVKLGAGGAGIVYQADDTRHNRPVAIKVLVGRTLDSTIRASFERELRAMGRLSGHPNIVTVHDSGFTKQGDPFLVMPLFAEGALGDRVNRAEPTPWSDVASIGVQVLSALATRPRLNGFASGREARKRFPRFVQPGGSG